MRKRMSFIENPDRIQIVEETAIIIRYISLKNLRNAVTYLRGGIIKSPNKKPQKI